MTKRVALIHDWLTGMRGGEKVLEAVCELYPDAEIFTLIYRPESVSQTLRSKTIHTSWLNKFPGVYHYYRYLLPLMPLAIRGFNLTGYDLVLSFNHCVAKGVKIDPKMDTLHICYCHTPMRYVYEQFQDYFTDSSLGWLKFGAHLFRPLLMRWDKKTSREVHYFVANSKNVRSRIQFAYGRNAEVIYPCVDTDFFTLPQFDESQTQEPYYLIAGALVPYKKVELAIAACRKLNVKLKVVGVGTERERLENLARGAQVEFLGWQSDESLKKLYQHCKALLFTANEDFGIVPVEAMACGKPVIAYQKGGALETVIEAKTGVFFNEQTVESLVEAIQRAEKMVFDTKLICAHAQHFNTQEFKSSFQRFITNAQARQHLTHVMQVVECGGPGGTGYQVAAICAGLDKSKFNLSLVYSVRPGASAQDYENMAMGTQRFFYVPQMVRAISPFKDFAAFCRLYQIFKSQRPDVVHTHSSKAGFLGRLAARLAGIQKIYYSPRGYSFLQTDSPFIIRIFYRLLERFASLFGEVIAVSQSEAQFARELGVTQVQVIADAYLGNGYHPIVRNGSKEISVCACARLTFARDPMAFVRLASQFKDSHPHVRFVWIGGGELQDAIESAVEKYQLSKTLSVTGWVSHEKALMYLSHADIFVHYSRWDAIANSILEAMALSLPVVASDIPGNRGLIEQSVNGYLVKNEVELKEKVLRLVNDVQLRTNMGQAGVKLVKSEYSRDRLMREITKLYAQSASR